MIFFIINHFLGKGLKLVFIAFYSVQDMAVRIFEILVALSLLHEKSLLNIDHEFIGNLKEKNVQSMIQCRLHIRV